MNELLDKYKHVLDLTNNRLSEIKGYFLNQKDSIVLKFEQIINIIKSEKFKIDIISKGLSNFNEYNEQFKSFINDYLNNIINSFNELYLKINVDNLQLEFKVIESCSTSLLINYEYYNSTYSIFEHFKYNANNYVIFGKNGAGKTTLLNHVSKNFFSNSTIIPANRHLLYQENYSSFNSKQNLNSILSESNPFNYMVREMHNHDRILLENNSNDKDTFKLVFNRIISSLPLERKVTFNYEFIYLYDDDIDQYSLEYASDGEKSIIYIILAVLLTPSNSFVFIDEPENHLNGALMCKLFDCLEQERKDLCFIYLTHNIDFIETRKNAKLVYLEKTKKYKEWSFKEITDYTDIPLDIILTIEGTKRNILFCEGNKNSIDYKIYSCLFENYDVIPIDSCELVKNNTKVINSKQYLFSRKAIGLIDDDYMTNDERKKLKDNNIFSIGYNECECFLIQSTVLEYVNKKLFNKNLDSIKNSIIADVKGNQYNNILNDFIIKRFSKIIYSNKIKYNDNFNNLLDEINKNNKRKLLDELDNFRNKINNSINFDELTYIIPGKMIIGPISKLLGLNSSNEYIDFIVKCLCEDSHFKQLMYKRICDSSNFNE